MAGCRIMIVITLVAWVLYALSRNSLVDYLLKMDVAAERAEPIASFSIRSVGWFLLFFTLISLLMAFILSRAFAGKAARWGIILLGLLVVVDLGHANQPWIRYWSFSQKYAPNPLVDFLRKKPYEYRVILTPFRGAADDLLKLEQMYRIEWAQHAFQYYDIESTEIVQMSRVPKEMEAFHNALFFNGERSQVYRLLRRWELTNTRYIVALASTLTNINEKYDPELRRFKEIFRFNIVTNGEPSTEGLIDNRTVQLATNGTYTLIEFSGALPRARLYSNWQVEPDDDVTLRLVGDPSFDPSKTVLVSGGLPAGAVPSQAQGQNPGSADIVNYSSRVVRIKANVTASSILLLNDKLDPAWHLTVDGHPATVLRCNYLMRGVYLNPGEHTVEFDFRPQAGLLRVSLAAIGVTGVFVLILAIAGVAYPAAVPVRDPEPVSTPPASPLRPASAPAPTTPPAGPAATSQASQNSRKQKRRASRSKR